MPAPSQQLRRRELADAVADLGEPTRFVPQHDTRLDLLITVLGFEDRALSVPRALADASVRAAHGAVFHYSTNAEDNRRNLQFMREAFSAMGVDEPITLPAGTHGAQALRRVISGLGSGARVAWDVSVASNDLIVEALGALLDTDVDLELLYSEAYAYRPSREEFESERERFVAADRMGLDEGVLDVFPSGEFSGIHSAHLPNELVIFPGFSRDRVRATISKVESDWIVAPDQASLVWMLGSPPHPELAWRVKALYEIHDIDPERAEVHELSTFDYRETLRGLEEVYQRQRDRTNITVSVLGSKMQAVGIALFCWTRPSVRALLSRPRAYNAAAYSRGTRAVWAIPLGAIDRVARGLRSVGTLEVVSTAPAEQDPGAP